MDPTDEMKRILLEERCPICGQLFTSMEEHVSNAHAGGLNVAFVKWVLQIHKDIEKIKRMDPRGLLNNSPLRA
jgi:hypothetical protein